MAWLVYGFDQQVTTTFRQFKSLIESLFSALKTKKLKITRKLTYENFS